MASYDEAKLTSTLRGSFSTFNPTTGANQNADSLPTGLVYKLSDGTTLAATVTISNITTGRYRYSVDVTAGNGFAAGEYYELWISAATTGDSTVTQSVPVCGFKAVTADIDTASAYIDTEISNIQSRLPAALVSGRMDASVGAMATDVLTSGALAASAVTEIQSGLSTLTTAQVNAEVLDVLQVDTFAELSAVPAATSSLKDKLTWLFMWARNKATQTSTQRKLYADDTTTVVSTETVADDGTTYSKGEAS